MGIHLGGKRVYQCVCVLMSMPNVCMCGVCAYSCRQVAMVASPLLSLISNQLSRLKPKVICGQKPFPHSLAIILFFLCFLLFAPAILWPFHAVPFACSFSLLCLLYFHHFPQPRPCPPLTLCLLSVN